MKKNIVTVFVIMLLTILLTFSVCVASGIDTADEATDKVLDKNPRVESDEQKEVELGNGESLSVDPLIVVAD